MIWFKLEDFNFQSWDGASVCAVCGSPMKKGHLGVFRPPHPDDVSGFFDICEDCIIEAADSLGFAPAEGLRRSIKVAMAAEAVAITAKEEMAEALATVTRENVRLQEVIDDLNAPLETPFADPYEEDDDDEDDA